MPSAGSLSSSMWRGPTRIEELSYLRPEPWDWRKKQAITFYFRSAMSKETLIKQTYQLGDLFAELGLDGTGLLAGSTARGATLAW